MDRVRIRDRSGAVVADVDPARVAGIHAATNADAHLVEIIYTSGQRAVIENVDPLHVMDQLFPRHDGGGDAASAPG